MRDSDLSEDREVANSSSTGSSRPDRPFSESISRGDIEMGARLINKTPSDSQNDESVGRKTSNLVDRPELDDQSDHHDPFHLDARSLLALIKEGVLEQESIPTESEILDRLKSDAFSKTIAIVQSLYFGIGVVVRASRGLSVSQLELATTGFAGCSVLTYFFNFGKPKSVGTVITVKHYPGPTPEAVWRLAKRSQNSDISPFLWLFEPKRVLGQHRPNDLTSTQSIGLFVILYLTAALFGGVHIGA